MEEILDKAISELQLDKSQWKLTKFGDVAIQQKGKVDRENTDLTRYVQGGHMNSEDLHLRSWGELEDEYLGPAFIRRFDEGDILYGSRRTYLRKVVIAPFSGITSNTTFVIRANEKNIDKRLLPFIMMSEGFTENSVRNSKGSVNPYINWKDIAKYEFLLPPKDQQAQLVKLLWAMDEVIEREKEVIKSAKILLSSERKRHYSKLNSDKAKLGDLAIIRAGYGFPIKHQGHRDKRLNFFKVADMNTEGNERYMSVSQNTIDDEILTSIKGKTHPKGTVVFPKVGAAIATEKKRILADESVVDNNTMGVTLNTDKITPEYLHDYFTRISLQSLSNVGAVPSINASIIADIRIGIPPKTIMIEYMNSIESIHSTIFITESKIKASQSLQKSLINQVF